MKPPPAALAVATALLFTLSVVGLVVVGGRSEDRLVPPPATSTTSRQPASTTTALVMDTTTTSLATTTSTEVEPVGTSTSTSTTVGVTTTTATAPANRRILAVEAVNGVDQIVRLNPDGSGRVLLTTSATTKADPQWTADSRYFVFVDDGDVFFLDSEARTNPQKVAASGAGLDFSNPNITSDLQRLVVQRTTTCSPQPCTGVSTVSLYTLSTGEARDIGRPGARDPALSPDGTRVAMVEEGALVTYVITGSDVASTRRVVVAGPGITSPTWSSDGQRLAFARSAEGTTRLFTVSSDGQGVTPVSATIAGGQPSFGRDGLTLLYVQGDDPVGKASLATVGVDGSGATTLSGPARGAPAW